MLEYIKDSSPRHARAQGALPPYGVGVAARAKQRLHHRAYVRAQCKAGAHRFLRNNKETTEWHISIDLSTYLFLSIFLTIHLSIYNIYKRIHHRSYVRAQCKAGTHRFLQRNGI